MHPLVILVAIILCLAIVVVAVEGGLVAWILKGGPDYLVAPCARCRQPSRLPVCRDCLDELDAMLETQDLATILERHPDFQQGFPDRSWPRDTGTKPR